MSKDNVGGAAFPTPNDPMYLGMSLRDYFAAKAMHGFAMDDILCNAATTAPEWYKSIAEASYGLADAMLKERNA